MDKKIATQKVTLDVSDGTQMNAYVARPAEEGNFPGMLVFQEAFGVNAHIRDVAERFARLGFVAIAPELFHRTGPGFEGSYTDFPAVMPHMQAMTVEGQTLDIRAAHDWLRADQRVEAERISCIGFCMGGRMSFLANSIVPLRAAISFYGGGIAPALLPKAPELGAPMLFLWGGLDKHIPAEQIQSVMEGMTKEDKRFVNVVISDADHGFFCDARASYNAGAARLAWSLTLEFLALHMTRAKEMVQ